MLFKKNKYLSNVANVFLKINNKKMEQSELIRESKMLQLKLRVNKNSHGKFFTATGPEYLLSGLTLFQVKVYIESYFYSSSSYSFQPGLDYDHSIITFIRFNKVLESDEQTYRIKLSSKEFNLNDKVFSSDDSWCQVHECQKLKTQHNINYVFDINVHLDLSISTLCAFTSLYEDTDVKDFELRGEDGSVSVHKAVLAGYSPVFKTMFSGKWRETSEGHVDIPGTSKQTLQQLKDYMYLQKLPETGWEQLLRLAAFYMMSDLEQKCSVKLLSTLTSQNSFDLIELAAKYKIRYLLLGILENVHRELIKVDDINKHWLRNKNVSDDKRLRTD